MTGTLRLLLVWAALLLLLAATIGSTFLPLGPMLPAVSYAIAIAKAGLVLWFFMEMRSEDGLGRLTGMAGFAWLGFLLVMIVADVATRA